MEFAGEFETHYTVCLDAGAMPEFTALREWGASHGLKYLHIVLDRGETTSQPMLTGRGHGTLSGERAKAEGIAGLLRSAGFRVNRVKIEASPWNEDLPRNDHEARTHPRERHWEHHVKLLLEPDTDVGALTAAAIRHGAHLSRNALKRREDGKQERFVTQRCFGVGRDRSVRELTALLATLEARQYMVLDVEEEFVVYDSAITVDRGWLAGTGGDAR